ncbi:MAG: GGDEF domain-containing protein [Candidatus Eisenbacteria sp.]|nr:GGDEF domain-containing protein [Candidatus Eisenbacteria bacterium]
MSAGRSRFPTQRRMDFVDYLTGLMEKRRGLEDGRRSSLRALVEETDRFLQWEGILDFLFLLDRDGMFRFLGKENGEKGLCYRFLDVDSKVAVVIPAPPVSLRTVEPDRARSYPLCPCPMPTSVTALGEAMRRLCRREVLERRLGEMVVLRPKGTQALVVGRLDGQRYDGSPRFLPRYIDEHVLKGGRCFLVSDLRSDPVLRAHPAGRGFGTMGAFPLCPDPGHAPLGVMEIWRLPRGGFEEENVRSLAGFGRFLAGLIANVEHLEKLIFVDAVAGVFNRRCFDEVLLGREIARADRAGNKVGLLLVDVDDFKTINDTCGHPVGDQVLREVARLMRDRLRPLVDSVARVGGDEFAVILPGMSSVDAARRVAERLKVAVTEFDFPHLSRAMPGPVGLSIGGAVHDGGTDSDRRPLKDPKGELVDRADRALYQAKEAGKNRVVIWEEETFSGWGSARR